MEEYKVRLKDSEGNVLEPLAKYDEKRRVIKDTYLDKTTGGVINGDISVKDISGDNAEFKSITSDSLVKINNWVYTANNSNNSTIFNLSYVGDN